MLERELPFTIYTEKLLTDVALFLFFQQNNYRDLFYIIAQKSAQNLNCTMTTIKFFVV